MCHVAFEFDTELSLPPTSHHPLLNAVDLCYVTTNYVLIDSVDFSDLHGQIFSVDPCLFC